MNGSILKNVFRAGFGLIFQASDTVDKNVGGQAVIEGVMMRSPEKVSTSVRLMNGSIVTKTDPFKSITKKHKLLGKPVLRGVISFFEMLVLGIKTLNYSAEMASIEPDAEPKPKSAESGKFDFAIAITIVVSLAIGLGVFFFLPILITQLLSIEREALEFNIVAGAVRMLIFLTYVWALSMFKSFRRVFEYHGAEHKSIFAFEADLPLEVKSTHRFTTYHPRCGTSFILIVALLAMITYMFSDAGFTILVGRGPNAFERFGTHLMFLPLVAGVSFELLKLSGKTRANPITKFLIAPGLWIQKITTKEPADDQVEVAMTALKESIAGTSLDPKPV